MNINRYNKLFGWKTLMLRSAYSTPPDVINSDTGDNFIKKNKPSGKEYLEAPLDQVIERANQKTEQSEIELLSVVLSAKANQDQRMAARQTFYTALASVFVALLSLISSLVIYQAQSQHEDTLRTELNSLISKYEALNQKLQQSEIDRARLAEQIVALKQSQTKPLVKKSSRPK